MLTRAAAQLETQDEAREFLDATCDDDPALRAELAETITVGQSAPDRAPSAELAKVGEVIADRFQLVRRLGEGGMAVVYEAMDTKLLERRALKFPKYGHSQSIPPEARSALRVTHGNICRIHEIHTAVTSSGPADFISMEFIEGETLSNRLKRGPVPQNEAVEIARQLCRGIEAAHNAHILHRDLKTNNVMLTRNTDGSLRVVITDFGLAQPLGSSGHRPTSSGLIGTPNYIAPERWKGATATPASDVYALGVILYELLTGSLPFPKGTPWQLRITSVPQPPSRSNAAPARHWDQIVLSCLQPDPTKRFGSASEVLKAVERAFVISYRRRWIAAVAAIALAATPVVIWRDRIWPPPFARLAILPVTGSSGDTTLDRAISGALLEVAGRLESIGAMSKHVVVIPVEEAIRYGVESPTAAQRLRATHASTVKIGPQGERIDFRATVTNTSTGEVLREFTGDFHRDDVAALSTSLAGVATSALRLDKAMPAAVAPAAYVHYAAGLASLRRTPKDFDAAIASFDQALKSEHGSALVHGGLAEAYLNKFTATNDRRWLSEASRFARQAESLHPDSPPVLLVKGSVEQEEGRPERAIELFRRAAELEPNNPEAWRRAGIALHRMSRNDEAVRALQKSIQLAPDYYAPRVELGGIHFRMGHYAEAVEDFLGAARVAPELPEAHSLLGGALLASGKDREAEESLRRSIALRPTRAALNNLGVSLRYQGRDREATLVLEKALSAGPDDARLRLNLGNSLLRTGRNAQARENFQRAHDLARSALLLNPRNAAARAQFAYSSVRLGQPVNAADEVEQAVRLAPSEYTVLFWGLMTLEALGRRTEALPLLDNASAEQLQDLRRQPDLAEFFRDPKSVAFLETRATQSQTTERKP
jgi:serine/threonine-protein kinase